MPMNYYQVWKVDTSIMPFKPEKFNGARTFGDAFYVRDLLNDSVRTLNQERNKPGKIVYFVLPSGIEPSPEHIMKL